MLHDQGLSKFLWAEAANTAVYVQNRCPHQALDSKTAEEMFIGKKPDVSHFRIFGSLNLCGWSKGVEISHDVTFDKDMAPRKINNLPIRRKDKEADTRNQGEKEDETMPDVDEPVDPIDPLPHEPSSSKRRPSWLRETLEDAERHIAPRGTFRESKKPNKY
eukprot:PITA_35273